MGVSIENPSYIAIRLGVLFFFVMAQIPRSSLTSFRRSIGPEGLPLFYFVFARRFITVHIIASSPVVDSSSRRTYVVALLDVYKGSSVEELSMINSRLEAQHP
jgi:hypothetical protein